VRQDTQDRIGRTDTTETPLAGPIGCLAFVYRGGWIEATLDAGLHWHCAAGEVVAMLEQASGVESMAADALTLDGAVVRRLGRHALYRAASRVGGRVTLGQAQPRVGMARESVEV